MAKAKYAHLVNPLRLWTESVRPSYRGKMADFSLLFDEQVYPNAPLWVETFYAYAPGAGVGVPGALPSLWKGQERKRKGPWGQHSHDNFDELFLFWGTDPTDNTRLGGEVEMWLGDGENAQKYIAKEPTAKWVPRGVAHNPWIVTKVDDPKYPIIIMVIALTHTYNTTDEVTKNYPPPPAFSMDKLGIEQPGKGKYTKYFNRMLLSQTIMIPQLRGRVCVPNLMFDDTTYRAPVWVEIFHVYAGGQGVGVPCLQMSPTRDGKMRDNRNGSQHSQNFDELFLFISADPHDTLNLGGEVVTYLGDEGYSLTKSTGVFVPAGTPHNPQYYKRVDKGRTYFMVVIALVDNAKFFEGQIQGWPAPKTFKF
jgi:hypothetical protein